MSSTIVNILTLKNSQAAYFLKSHLDSFGIESFLSSVESNTSRIMGKTEGVKVKVRDQDVEKAIQVILEISNEYGKLEDQGATYFRKILVPVDFTDSSVKACQYAIGLAENLHGEIRLLHVYDDPLSKDTRIKQTSTFEKYHQEQLRKVEETCKDNIVRFTKELKNNLDPEKVTRAKIHYSMALGRFETELTHVEETYKPEVIVLGVGRRTDITNQLTEPFCLKIAQNVKVPLLVIPENADFQGADNINVLYATDFLDSDFTSFRRLLALLAPFKVRFFCIHVGTDDENAIKVKKMDELNEVLRQDYKNYSIELRLIKNDDMINGIMEFSQKNDIQMISFTNPRKSMIYRLLSPNNLKRMIHRSKIPMFIFRT